MEIPRQHGRLRLKRTHCTFGATESFISRDMWRFLASLWQPPQKRRKQHLIHGFPCSLHALRGVVLNAFWRGARPFGGLSKQSFSLKKTELASKQSGSLRKQGNPAYVWLTPHFFLSGSNLALCCELLVLVRARGCGHRAEILYRYQDEGDNEGNGAVVANKGWFTRGSRQISSCSVYCHYVRRARGEDRSEREQRDSRDKKPKTT